MCYSGRCRFEDRNGDCKKGGKVKCPDEVEKENAEDTDDTEDTEDMETA
jgi:hypothetical protein